MASVLVFAETREGRLKKAALEALSTGRRLAESSGGSCAALLVGPGGLEALAGECGRYGADRVLLAEGEGFSAYAPEAWRDALLAAIRAAGVELVLLPASATGLELAARVAARLDVSSLSDVVELKLESSKLVARRPVYAGKALATVETDARPAIATLRANVFPATEHGRAGTPEPLAVAVGPVRARVVSFEQAAVAELDVAEAPIVVSGGRGLKAPENFALVRDLARTLRAAVGASRAVVDAGWIEHSHQVGQTGKTVSPALYIAVGISGAIQHLAGMSSAKVIVAINKDADAPIFKHATYGVVGDLFEVVPALTDALKAYQARHG